MHLIFEFLLKTNFPKHLDLQIEKRNNIEKIPWLNTVRYYESELQACSVAMPQHVPQSLPNPPCVECLLNNSVLAK